jgi:hypothetical protein
MWENAKVEKIICSGLQPPYDGSSDKLIPTLNLIHIRHKNEVWYPATFVVQDGIDVDLVLQFSKLTTATVFAQAKRIWDAPDASIRSHTRGSDAYNANSLTHDFAAIFHSRIDLLYCSNGPLLLHTMCQHIHCNHLAFVETIKNKIRLATLAEFKNDVQAYLHFLTDNLKLISSTEATDTEHKDLLLHLFLQLRTTTIPVFQQSVLKWQRDFLENTLSLTPSTLVSKADQECQMLTHTGQWVETIDPSVVAMQAMFHQSKAKTGDVFTNLAANFSQITQRQKEIARSIRSSYRGASNSQTPEWLLDALDDLEQIKYFNGRYWHYCTKCGRNDRWVCTHTNATHDDSTHSPSPNPTNRRSYTPEPYDRTSYRSWPPSRNKFTDQQCSQGRLEHRSRSRSPHNYGYHSTSAFPKRQVTWNLQAPPTPVAKLSLLDSFSDFLEA